MTDTMTQKQTHGGPEIDAELLEEARRQIGAAWPNEAINAALRELVEDRRTRRMRALEAVRTMAEEGLLDFDAIEEADR